eukprot:1143039-Pelagomonas_calceolata.AAC.2
MSTRTSSLRLHEPRATASATASTSDLCITFSSSVLSSVACEQRQVQEHTQLDKYKRTSQTISNL